MVLVVDEDFCCGALIPERMSVARGTAMASCPCGFRCGYWECACELIHDCVLEDEE